ncbi:hypothetical protein [Nonomuraea sp. NPDC049480]|uniref:hypothetical protein n=1 Tax=Nonomuraea sp. NPDC049480 TaxID=3364353 RepID=UPI00379D5AD1
MDGARSGTVSNWPTSCARRFHALLRASGRQRNITTWSDRLQALFGGEHLRRLPLVEEALGRQAQALLSQLDAACRAADDLAEATSDAKAWSSTTAR